VIIQNVGDARHQGIELATEFDVTGWWDDWKDTDFSQTIGIVNLFFNLMLLDAEFTGGSNEGKTPQYAPDHILRGGIEYLFRDKVKVRLGGTFVDDHFANDSNSAEFFIPSYQVWDLTAEVKVYKDILSLFGGVNNLFDESYFARVRSDGIDPADGRNYYGGAKIRW
jgi:outer membrane receptor protein involved in Fe transport